MNILDAERRVLEELMPGLDEQLVSIPLELRERKGSPVLSWFKQSGGTSLLIPRDYGGKEVTPLEMVRVQRALGSRSPSLALGTNMHSCTIAAIPPCEATASLLKMIAQDNLYVASGFSEGCISTSIQSPNMRVQVVEGGFLLTGSKKPCSLAVSMDLFTASVLIPRADGRPRFALVTIPSDSHGISVKPFANEGFLEAAENYEVILEEVFVPDDFVSYFGEEMTLTEELSFAFLWFEMFVSASYLGAASGLVELVYLANRGSVESRSDLMIALDAVMLSLEGVAHEIMAGNLGEETVVRSLTARFNAQRAIAKVASDAAELLGGIRYLSSFDVSYHLKVSRALSFHPPSKWVMAEHLDSFYKGGKLAIP